MGLERNRVRTDTDGDWVFTHCQDHVGRRERGLLIQRLCLTSAGERLQPTLHVFWFRYTMRTAVGFVATFCRQNGYIVRILFLTRRRATSASSINSFGTREYNALMP